MTRRELDKRLKENHFTVSYGVVCGASYLIDSRLTGIFERLLLIIVRKVILHKMCCLDWELKREDQND